MDNGLLKIVVLAYRVKQMTAGMWVSEMGPPVFVTGTNDWVLTGHSLFVCLFTSSLALPLGALAASPTEDKLPPSSQGTMIFWTAPSSLLPKQAPHPSPHLWGWEEKYYYMWQPCGRSLGCRSNGPHKRGVIPLEEREWENRPGSARLEAMARYRRELYSHREYSSVDTT